MRVLVLGLGMTGDALVRHLTARGDAVVVVDDGPTAASKADPDYSTRVAAARDRGATVWEAPTPEELRALVADAELVVPSPGISPRHPALSGARAADVAVRSEIDLAAELAGGAGRSGPTLVAVTGTNGKTTVTTLATAMLEADGRRALAAGNIGHPLIDALDPAPDPAQDADAAPEIGAPEFVVAEVSSFQLTATTDAFAPRAAALLNLGDDHLDWHRTFDAYARAKAQIFAHQGPDDLLVFNADDPVVAGLAAEAPGRTVAFSVTGGAATGYRLVDAATGPSLVAPDGTELVPVRALAHHAPHDLANALAAAALALDLGVDPAAVSRALTGFRGLPHRMQQVGSHHGVHYIDDSKATNPHATIAAVGGLEDVILLAGGANKGLDLTQLRVLEPRLRAVIAIGDAAAEIVEVFAGLVPVAPAASMDEAVVRAAEAARPGDTVLLAPACASFDWYPSYAARGDDFARAVRELVEVDR